MNLQKYIDKVLTTRKVVFSKITIEKNFEWKKLIKICDLTLSNECLNVTWSLIIDSISETYKDEKMISFIPESVLDFLIDNSICLMDLAHLKLSENYLLKIYEKDKSCWEALRTMETYNK